MEKLRDKARKVFRVLSRYLNNKQDFENYLIKALNLTPETLKNAEVNKTDLTKCINGLFENVGEKDIRNDEVEGFLSIFNFNNHHYTKAGDLGHIVYEEDDF